MSLTFSWEVPHGHSERDLNSGSPSLRTDQSADRASWTVRVDLAWSDFYVVLLSPMELDTTMRMILQVPIWAQRVIYIQGSCLKDTDLARARMNEAEACFVLAARNYADKTAAVSTDGNSPINIPDRVILRYQRVYWVNTSITDPGVNNITIGWMLGDIVYVRHLSSDEHTILRSWAVKDFAPSVPQYVQIFRPENKLHVKFAEHVVCEDEFKYALLANNCTCPGASTLVTLLLHTSRGQEGQTSQEEWHRLYGKCSGNEIYHIVLGDSRFFGEYDGKSFTYASFHSHRKYGVALVGVRPAELPEFYEDTILLNPGPRHIMKKSDTCYYMSISKEENSAFVLGNSVLPDGVGGGTGVGGGEKSALGKEKGGGVGGPQHKPDGIEFSVHIPNSICTTTSLDPSYGDSRTFLKDSSPSTLAPDVAITGNHLDVPKPGDNPNLLSPEILSQRRGSRRPSILPVPDMFTSSSLNIASEPQDEDNESDDEMDDDVPWRSPSEKIAYDESLSSGRCAKSAWHIEYSRIVKGFPPVSPYIGVSPTLCYLLKEKKPLCCLQLAQMCEHCSYRNAKEYNWQNKTIILAADYASNGIYNFIIPLRAHFRSKTSLNPIILLLERRPDVAFLDSISYFPLVYWMQGSIDCLDDLLRAGITLAENVVVVNKEITNSAEEDTLADCNTIVAVQTMFKFFPSIKSITELSQSSNMRFMQFRAHDKYALHLSKMEKVLGLASQILSADEGATSQGFALREKERGSHISYMFRLPFAAGSVFSASMLDTLLYQAFVKDYVITFVRLLLGIDQAPGSGFLTSMKITKDDMWIRTYGRLYQKLCSTTCEIPIGIYRTQDTSLSDSSHVSNSGSTPRPRWTECVRVQSLPDEDTDTEHGGGVTYRPKSQISDCLSCVHNHRSTYSINMADEARDNHTQMIERAEIANLVRSRMESLNLPGIDYDDVSEKRSSLSYVIINPSCDLKLEEGDIIYLVRPSPFSAQKTFERHNSRRKSNISFCSQQLVQQMANSAAGSRRGSGLGLPGYTSPRPPPLVNTKANSLSLPDSPTVVGAPPTCYRGRSNSLRVVDDILLRRSNSLRQGLVGGRRKSSLEDIGVSFASSHPSNYTNPIKIALNGSIGLEVTPPEEGSTPSDDSGTELLTVVGGANTLGGSPNSSGVGVPTTPSPSRAGSFVSPQGGNLAGSPMQQGGNYGGGNVSSGGVYRQEVTAPGATEVTPC
uniref:Potassium channel subfamily T member 1 n=1 Tax=Timema shepardi TaxID=629360 RepID=A0A7R9AKJ1_TIMSH|nr:unnamed protein product [Timema shepardi]